jgi:integrative and conjugative element protein (TIGR02256 family)
MSSVREIGKLFANPIRAQSFVLIERDVLEALYRFRQTSHLDDEAGGILIGYRRQQHLHVVEFTAPAAADRRSRCEFERSDPHHAYHAHARWKASRGTLDCLGEWHTHPQDDPAPSSIDHSEWRRILSRLRVPKVFLIIGRRQDWVGVGHGDRISSADPVGGTRLPGLRRADPRLS